MYTHYVPHDVPGLVSLFGGPEKYVAALDEQFKLAAKNDFVTEHGKHFFQWVDYGNQPSTAMAHMFNLAGAPWLSQKWVRAVKQQTFGDITPNGGYLGDEDQGQMGALSAMMAMGLFDVEGGAAVKPTYQITAPVFDRVTIHLNPDYFARGDFTIITRNNSPRNIYIQRAWLNGKPLERCWFEHAELVRGGKLEIELGPEANRAWGLGGLREARAGESQEK
jgi:putative alpha-1,2-mannosidase